MDSTAVFGRRVVAAVIDAALLLIPAVVLLVGSFEYYDVGQRDPQTYCDQYMDELGGVCVPGPDDRVYFSDEPGAGPFLITAGGALALHVILQGLTGWTIGKLVMGIRTVREDGSPPGVGRAFVRWVLLLIDGQPCGIPLVGFITALTTTGHRRVGDMAASTYVVRATAAGAPIVLAGSAPSEQPPWSTGGWPASPAPPTPSPTSPQWDAARGAYIQWDPARARWLQWDDATSTWAEIPGQ